MSAELSEVSLFLAAEGRNDFADVAQELPDASAWKAPLVALADGRFGDAAVGFEAMEAVTLAAEAHLRAARAGEPGQHANLVRAFADPRGAQRLLGLLAGSDDRALRDGTG